MMYNIAQMYLLEYIDVLNIQTLSILSTTNHCNSQTQTPPPKAKPNDPNNEVSNTLKKYSYTEYFDNY